MNKGTTSASDMSNSSECNGEVVAHQLSQRLSRDQRFKKGAGPGPSQITTVPTIATSTASTVIPVIVPTSDSHCKPKTLGRTLSKTLGGAAATFARSPLAQLDNHDPSSSPIRLDTLAAAQKQQMGKSKLAVKKASKREKQAQAQAQAAVDYADENSCPDSVRDMPSPRKSAIDVIAPEEQQWVRVKVPPHTHTHSATPTAV